MYTKVSQEKNCTTKRFNLRLCREELYLNRTCIIDARILQALTREHPSTFSSKYKETCGGGTYNESCRSGIDFRIQGLHHSAVQEQDHIFKEAVQKLIHQFETHPNKEALQADLMQNHEFNPIQRESKEIIHRTGNMEYFEMCEITPKSSAITV